MDDLPADQVDEPTRDVWFNPYRTPTTERAWAVVNEVAAQVEALENIKALRQRKRRADDEANFKATIAALVSDLIYFHLAGHPGGLIVTRSNQILGKRSRYRPAIYSKA